MSDKKVTDLSKYRDLQDFSKKLSEIMQSKALWEEFKATENDPEFKEMCNQTVIGNFQFGDKATEKTVVSMPMRYLDATVTLKHFEQHVENGLEVIAARKLLQAAIQSVENNTVALKTDDNDKQAITASLTKAPVQKFDFKVSSKKGAETLKLFRQFVDQRTGEPQKDLYLNNIHTQMQNSVKESQAIAQRQTMRAIPTQKPKL